MIHCLLLVFFNSSWKCPSLANLELKNQNVPAVPSIALRSCQNSVAKSSADEGTRTFCIRRTHMLPQNRHLPLQSHRQPLLREDLPPL